MKAFNEETFVEMILEQAGFNNVGEKKKEALASAIRNVCEEQFQEIEEFRDAVASELQKRQNEWYETYQFEKKRIAELEKESEKYIAEKNKKLYELYDALKKVLEAREGECPPVSSEEI